MWGNNTDATQRGAGHHGNRSLLGKPQHPRPLKARVTKRLSRVRTKTRKKHKKQGRKNVGHESRNTEERPSISSGVSAIRGGVQARKHREGGQKKKREHEARRKRQQRAAGDNCRKTSLKTLWWGGGIRGTCAPSQGHCRVGTAEGSYNQVRWAMGGGGRGEAR